MENQCKGVILSVNLQNTKYLKYTGSYKLFTNQHAISPSAMFFVDEWIPIPNSFQCQLCFACVLVFKFSLSVFPLKVLKSFFYVVFMTITIEFMRFCNCSLLRWVTGSYGRGVDNNQATDRQPANCCTHAFFLFMGNTMSSLLDHLILHSQMSKYLISLISIRLPKVVVRLFLSCSSQSNSCLDTKVYILKCRI